MNAPTAICPQCQKQVSFIKDGQFARCPECGFQYRLEPPRIDTRGYEPERPAHWTDALKALAIVFLIMAGIVVVGIGVLFAGCALALRGI
jgi:hypothetical protein